MMKLRLVDDWAPLRDRADEWNALLDGSRPEDKFLTFEWSDALRQARSPGQAVPALVGEDAGRLIVVWPLILTKRTVARVVPCRIAGDLSQWFAPHHGVICARDRVDVIYACIDFLRRHVPRWDVLELGGILENGETHRAIESACRELHLCSDLRAGTSSPYLPLENTWQDYLAGCSSKFRSDLKRCEKSLAKLGQPECRFHEAYGELSAAYEQVLAVERQSWKHSEGSAITSRPWEDALYRELLDRAGPRGWLQVTLLTIDGEPVAHDFGMIYQGRYACLKTSFVERVRSANAGKVLRRHIIESLYARGIREHDFLGEAEPWKLQWTREVRPHVTLVIYRHRWHAHARRLVRQLRAKWACEPPATGPSPAADGE